MKLSKEAKKLLSDEFNFVINKMESSETPDQMLYFFTGIHTMIQRIFNIEFSDDLLFAYIVLDRAYQDIISRLQALKSGAPVIMFHNDFSLRLVEYTKDLERNFYDNSKRLEVLKKITVLAYTASGNGYYLTQKKMINLFPNEKQLNEK